MVPGPDAVFIFPGGTHLIDVALLPGGEQALALFVIGSVNIWAVIASAWLEIAALPLGAAILFGWLRLLKRPQQAGEQYCRRCNYVVGHGGHDCPECGLTLTSRNRVAGQPRRWRRVVYPLVLVLLGAMYVVGWHHASRDVAANWMYWNSTGLYHWAVLADVPWLRQRRVWTMRVEAIDLDTGRTARTILRHRYRHATGITVDPDGETFLLRYNDEIARHRLVNGAKLTSYRHPEGSGFGFNDHALGSSQDTIYATLQDQHIVAWPRTGGPGALLRVVENTREIVKLIPGRDQAISLLSDGNGEVRITRRSLPDLTVLDSHTHDIMARQFAWSVHREHWLVGSTWSPCGVYVWNLENGERIASFAINAPGAAAWWCAMDSDARFLAVAEINPSRLEVFDLYSQTSVLQLDAPITEWKAVSLAEESGMILALGADTSSGQSISKLLRYDLEDLFSGHRDSPGD